MSANDGSGRKNYETLNELLLRARESMEHLRAMRITVEIDTNKAVYTKTFDNWREALSWLRRLGFDLGILQ